MKKQERERVNKWKLQLLFYASTSGKLDYKELGVYTYLLERYNAEYGYAFPSRNTIMKEINISEPTLYRIINSLINKGFISKERGREGRCTRYYLLDNDTVSTESVETQPKQPNQLKSIEEEEEVF